MTYITNTTHMRGHTMSDNKKRYVLTKRYAIALTEEEFNNLKNHYIEEWAETDTVSVNEMEVISAIVEEFHVGDNTDIVWEIDQQLTHKNEEDPNYKFPWED